VEFENFHAVLALILSGVSPRRCAGAQRQPEDIFELLQSGAGRRQIGDELGCSVGDIDWTRFDDAVRALTRTGAKAVSWWDTDYPVVLRAIDEPPPLLFYKGSLPGPGDQRGIGIVGTRRPTPSGVALARRLGNALSVSGIPMVSGMARGIDTAAHNGALGGSGGTIAVIGTGIDVPYPAENAGLMVDIARSGCVISEQLPGTPATRHVFPRRNRLISALTHAVVVVQGGIRSGALITARWALEQGRDVGAVPGFPGDYRSAGPNALLKQGAFVVETERDIFDNVPAVRQRTDRTGESAVDAERSDPSLESLSRTVLEAVGTTPVEIDALSRHIDLDVAAVQRCLLELEIAGFVERDAAGRFVRH